LNEQLVGGVLPPRSLRFPLRFEPALPLLFRFDRFKPHGVCRGDQGSDEVVEAAVDSLSSAIAPGLALS
jgi:hypothetical protein